jgi:hypothetical protein
MGVWEQGKKLKWWSSEEVNAIQNGEMDFTLEFGT